MVLFLVSLVQTFAIEGLKLSLQCSNVVLSWPSMEGETYIVQYRPTLRANDPWRTLTSSLPAGTGTNITLLSTRTLFNIHNAAVVDRPWQLMEVRV